VSLLERWCTVEAWDRAAHLSKWESRLYRLVCYFIKEEASIPKAEWERWTGLKKPSDEQGEIFESYVDEWVDTSPEVLLAIRSDFIKGVIGWYGYWYILVRVAGIGLLSSFIAALSIITPGPKGSWVEVGVLISICCPLFALPAVAYYSASWHTHALYLGDRCSLDDVGFVAVLIKHSGSIRLGPRLREGLVTTRSGLGLSGDGYEIINSLAGEWELTFGELLAIAGSLSA